MPRPSSSSPSSSHLRPKCVDMYSIQLTSIILLVYLVESAVLATNDSEHVITSSEVHRTRHHSGHHHEVSYHLVEPSDAPDDAEDEALSNITGDGRAGGGGGAGFTNGPRSKENVMANYTGDIIIAAIFPVHDRKNYSCGSLQVEGLQQLEALVYSMHRINNNTKILPGIKLGLLIADSCDNPHHALSQTTDFIKSFIARKNARQSVMDFRCGNGSQPPIYKEGRFDRVVGLIGGQSSETSIQLANLLRLFQIPQVSYMSTSPTLSDKRLYEYFFRTVPSDTHQAVAIVQLLKKNQWTYVSIVYSNTEYGNNGYNLITSTAARFNICISSPQMINVERFQEEDYDNTIVSLTQKTNAKVVILYTDQHVARKVLMAATRIQAKEHRNIVNKIIWIASDAWCCRESVTHGLEGVIEGAISITPQHYHLEGFSDYFQSLRPENNPDNPWFKEYWRHHSNCSLVGGQSVCSIDKDLPQSPTLHFIRDAFYSYSFTFQYIHEKYCHKKPGICPEMERILMDGRKLARRLKNVNFKDEGNRTFRFLANGDAPPRYRVVNFRKTGNDTWHWETVGDYLMENNKPRLKISELRFKHNSPVRPQSFCSEPCGIGQAKLQLEGDTCCWLCTNCSEYQISNAYDEFNCVDCPRGWVPNDNKTECVPVPSQYLSITNWWSIGAMVYAVVGMLMTCLTWYVFWYYAETPIIKAAGRELSNLLLAGIFLSFATTFVIISPPLRLTCSLTRFLLGFCYTICYSAIFTKTNRIARIFRNRSCQRPKFISPRSQLVITFLLIVIEILINLLWMVYDPPDTAKVYPNRDTAILICSGSDQTSYLLGLVYPLVLICFCTVYAFKTRKCPEGFNEARHITFTNYTTCVVWLAFLPLYVILGNSTTPWRSITLCLLLSVSGTVQLFCLFVPKMYIALLKPEKNTRETVMFRMTNTVSYHNHQLEQHYHNQGRAQLRKSSSANDARTLLQMACKNRFPVEQISTSSEMETTTTSCNDQRHVCCNNGNNAGDPKGHGCASQQQHWACCTTQAPSSSSHHHHHHHNIYHHHRHHRSTPTPLKNNLVNCRSCCSCSSLAKSSRRSASSNTHKRPNWQHSTTTSPIDNYKPSSLSASNSNGLILPTPSPVSCPRSTTPSPRPDLSDCLVMSLLQSNQQSPTSPTTFSVNSSSSKSSPSTVVNNIVKVENGNFLKEDSTESNATSIKGSTSTPSLVYGGGDGGQTNGNCLSQGDPSKEAKTVLENGHEHEWPAIRVEARLSN